MSFPFVLCSHFEVFFMSSLIGKAQKKGYHVLIGGTIMFVVLWKGKKKSSRGVFSFS